MAIDKHEFIITWVDAVTGEEETRKATEKEIQEILDAGYGQNLLVDDPAIVDEPTEEPVDDLVEGEQL